MSADLTETGTVTTEAGAGVTAREQTAGNYEEAPFPESCWGLADKEVSVLGRDVALCCLLNREQRKHYPPAASGLKFFNWDIASWDCCFSFCTCRHLSHCYYVHEVVLKAVVVSELNPCSHKPSESQKASCRLWLSGISKLCGHQEFQQRSFSYVPWKVVLPKDVD